MSAGTDSRASRLLAVTLFLASGVSAAAATPDSSLDQVACLLLALAAAPLAGLAAARPWLPPAIWVAACGAGALVGWVSPLVASRLAACGLAGAALWVTHRMRRSPVRRTLLATLGVAVLMADGALAVRLGDGQFAGASVALATLVRLLAVALWAGLAFEWDDDTDEAMGHIAAFLAGALPEPGPLPPALQELATGAARIRERLAQERDQAAAMRSRIVETVIAVQRESERYQRGASEQVGSISETSVTSEELLETSRQVEEQVREVVSVASASLESARGGVRAAQAFSATIGSLGGACRSVAEHLSHLRELVQRLASSLDELFRVTSKADVLALSAELEASDVEGGEARFLSVASQMRQLGEVVTSAVGEIGPLLEEIRNLVRASARASDLGAGGTARGLSLSRSFAGRLSTIADLTAVILRTIEEIAPLTEVQVRRTAELDQSLIRLAEATRGRAAASTSFLAASRALEDIAWTAPARES